MIALLGLRFCATDLCDKTDDDDVTLNEENDDSVLCWWCSLSIHVYDARVVFYEVTKRLFGHERFALNRFEGYVKEIKFHLQQVFAAQSVFVSQSIVLHTLERWRAKQQKLTGAPLQVLILGLDPVDDESVILELRQTFQAKTCACSTTQLSFPSNVPIDLVL